MWRYPATTSPAWESNSHYLQPLAETADVFLYPGRNVAAPVEVEPGLDDGGGGQPLQTPRALHRGGGRVRGLAAHGGRVPEAGTLQDAVIDVGVVPHEGGLHNTAVHGQSGGGCHLKIIVVAVSVEPLQSLKAQKDAWQRVQQVVVNVKLGQVSDGDKHFIRSLWRLIVSNGV